MSTRCEIFWEYWTEVLKSSCRLDFSFFFFFFDCVDMGRLSFSRRVERKKKEKKKKKMYQVNA